MNRLSAVLLGITFLLVPSARGDEPFALKGGERILFIGDSITQAGDYIVDFEAYLLTRFPDKTFTVLNHGLSSETTSGTSEPDHSPRRPCIHDRFTRDVTDWKPDVVIACYGMNDGNYFPYFNEEKFALYQSGIRRLLARIRDEAHARPILMTPPPYDALRLQDSDPKAKDFGYKHPSPDYDRTLARYSEWLLTLRGDGVTVADVHSASNDFLRHRRENNPKFYLAGDAVHPGPIGHWLIAQTLLLAMHAPGTVADLDFDASSLKIKSGEARDLGRAGDAIRFSWTTRLPMPLDPSCDAQILSYEHFSERLNRQRLTVENLGYETVRLDLRIDGEPGYQPNRILFTSFYLSRGADLTADADFPTTKLARSLRPKIVARRRSLDSDWREHRDRVGVVNDPELEGLRKECRPREINITLSPAK